MMPMQDKKRRSRARFQDPLKFFPRVRRKLHSEWLRYTYPFASFGSKVSIDPTCTIDRLHAHRIKVGNQVSIEKDAALRLCVPAEEEGEPIIIIEDNCVINWRSQIDAKNCVHLEAGVLVAQDVLIVDQNHAYEDISTPIRDQGLTKGGKIRIGEGSFIAHGASIICSRGDLVLGRNCVVAAHAVVTRSAPAHSVLYGNPARIIRQYDPTKQVWIVGPIRSGETEQKNQPEKAFERASRCQE
jgi:acetyltransferase-like isoleucine patch superfamily enzyme